MSLSTNINALAQAVGADIKAVNARIDGAASGAIGWTLLSDGIWRPTGSVVEPPALFLSTEGRTVAIGDSITATNADLGAGTRGTSWFHQVSILSQARIRYGANLSVGGQTSAQIKDRFVADVVNRTPKPGIVLIMCGTNDTAASVATATIMANIDTMVQAALAASIQPIVCAPPPVVQAPQSANLLALRDALAAYTGCRTIVSTFDNLKDGSGVLAAAYRSGGDDTHPNQVGQRALADAFVAEMPTAELPAPLPLSTVARPSGTLLATGIDAIMSVDSDANGIADGSHYYYAEPANVTHSLVTGAPAGRWQRATKTGLADWSFLWSIDFDVTSLSVGTRFILATRISWDGTGNIGATLYEGSTQVGLLIQNNTAADHQPFSGVLNVELVKGTANAYTIAFNTYPGSGNLDLAQYTGTVLA